MALSHCSTGAGSCLAAVRQRVSRLARHGACKIPTRTSSRSPLMQSAFYSDRLASNSLACSTSRTCCGSLLHASNPLNARRKLSSVTRAACTSRLTSASHFGCTGQENRERHTVLTKRARRSHIGRGIKVCATADVPHNSEQPLRYSKSTIAFSSDCDHPNTAQNSMCRQHKPFSRMCLLFGAAILPGNGFLDLGQNYVFMAGFWGWFLAQTCKVRVKLISTCSAADRCTTSTHAQ